MAYRVTALHGVFVMLPTAMFSGHKQVHEFTSLPLGFKLPDTVRPEAIAHLLAEHMIEEVNE